MVWHINHLSSAAKHTAKYNIPYTHYIYDGGGGGGG